MSKLDDVVIFEYKTDEFGRPINSLQQVKANYNVVKQALPDNNIIALPDTITLKDINENDLKDINKRLLDDVIEIMDIHDDDWMDELKKVDVSEMRVVNDE